MHHEQIGELFEADGKLPRRGGVIGRLLIKLRANLQTAPQQRERLLGFRIAKPLREKSPQPLQTQSKVAPRPGIVGLRLLNALPDFDTPRKVLAGLRQIIAGVSQDQQRAHPVETHREVALRFERIGLGRAELVRERDAAYGEIHGFRHVARLIPAREELGEIIQPDRYTTHRTRLERKHLRDLVAEFQAPIEIRQRLLHIAALPAPREIGSELAHFQSSIKRRIRGFRAFLQLLRAFAQRAGEPYVSLVEFLLALLSREPRSGQQR